MKTIVVVSGGFDPVHSGHIKLIKEARSPGDILIVGINSDEWLAKTYRFNRHNTFTTLEITIINNDTETC